MTAEDFHHRPINSKGLPAFTINRPLSRLRPVWWSVAAVVILLCLIEVVLILGPWIGWLVWPEAAWTGLSLRESPLRNLAVFYYGFFPLGDSGLAADYTALSVSLESLSRGEWGMIMAEASKAVGMDNLRPAECHATLYAATQQGLRLADYWGQNHCAALADALTTHNLLSEAPAPQYWHGLTAQLLHGGPVHLAMNMACVLIWMPFLVVRLGIWRLVLLTLAAMLASALAFVLWTGAVMGMNTPMVGFSGVAFAFLGAHLHLGWTRARKRGDVRPVRSVIVAMIAINIAFLVLDAPVAGDAHLGGMLAGFYLMPLLMPNAGTHRSRLTRMVRKRKGANA